MERYWCNDDNDNNQTNNNNTVDPRYLDFGYLE